MATQMPFADQVVLVTGSGSGIGRACAIEFARHGANCVVCDKNEKTANETADQIKKIALDLNANGPREPLIIVADMSRDEDCKRTIDQTIKHFGQLDVLVNNAGIPLSHKLRDPKCMETFDQLYRLNLRSSLLMCHLAVDHLAKTKGAIVNMSSVSGMKPVRYSSDWNYFAANDPEYRQYIRYYSSILAWHTIFQKLVSIC